MFSVYELLISLDLFLNIPFEIVSQILYYIFKI